MPNPQPLPIDEQILRSEARRCALLVANDLDGFADMLADDLVYVHSSGRADSKQSYVASRRASPMRFLKFEHEDLRVRVCTPVTAILTGLIRHWQQPDVPRTNLFTSVWVRDSIESEAWRFASYHACKAASD